VSPYYDPLLAKIIAHGRTRDAARQRLIEALGDTVTLGPATNRGFLIDCLGHPEFGLGTATTPFIPTHFTRIAPPQLGADVAALAAVLWFEASTRRHGHDPARTWSSSGAIPWPVRLEAGGVPVDLTVSVLGPRRYLVAGAGTASSAIEMGGDGDDDGIAMFRLDGEERRAAYALAGETLHLKVGSLDLAVCETLYAPRATAGADGSIETEVRAPMSGKVVAVLVAEGQAVERGQRLVVVEAMKMQHEMSAAASGTVARLAVKPGDQVATRQLLVELRPEPKAAE
jgi:geranyl-CoA carboxylase alpha subunit